MSRNLESKNDILFIPEKLMLITLRNKAYRRVIGTDKQGNQFVVMKLEPGEQTDFEIHPNTDQAFYIVQGECLLEVINPKIVRKFETQNAFMIKRKTSHNIKNDGKIDLKLITKYIGKQLHDPSVVELNQKK
jgi:mannose-6-phosphate isomerase-like protein (cupin superfamily)